jgi:pimeloyl-ACP methyl ester carboxylesterase
MRINTLCLLVLQAFCAVYAYGSDGNQIGYVYPPRKDRDTVIVFIHGFNGDPVGTWTNEKTGAYFPKLVADDKDIDADVYVYSYPSPARWLLASDHAQLVPTLAADLITTVESEILAKGKHRIVLVAHSMGGLVAWSMLCATRTGLVAIGDIPMLYTYATPGNGAGIANIAKYVLNNKQLSDLEPIEGNAWLQQIRLDWRNSINLRRLDAYCAFEEKDTAVPKIKHPSIRIVPEESATALCNQKPHGILADHFEIVKPDNTTSDAYLSFKNAFLSERAKWRQSTSLNRPPETRRVQ